jgi:HAMP domain-containing protein
MKGEAGIMHNLVTALVAITLGVLFLLVIASFYLVRRALQPLNQVEQTAGRIAEGQLDRRVPDWSPTTEVGRLSVALNRMLEQIQGAFIKVNQSEQQAREAEQQARSAESSMRRFIGDASHELRTPLTSVRGYADLYKSGATEDADMVIDRISSEAGRMSLLVEDLLTLVRMDEGRPMRSDLVDLLELCIAAVDNARAGFPGRSISVQNESRGGRWNEPRCCSGADFSTCRFAMSTRGPGRRPVGSFRGHPGHRRGSSIPSSRWSGVHDLPGGSTASDHRTVGQLGVQRRRVGGVPGDRHDVHRAPVRRGAGQRIIGGHRAQPVSRDDPVGR